MTSTDIFILGVMNALELGLILALLLSSFFGKKS